MVSINAAPSSSPRTRNGRLNVMETCRILILLAGCIAVIKIARNGRDLGDMIQDVNYSAISTSSSTVIRPLRQDYGDTCRLYLAESAIPNGGLGVFTTVGILPNEKVGLDDICLMVEHLPSYKESHLPTHTWGSANVFGQFEASHSKGKTKAACEGLGTLYNAAPPDLATTHKIAPHHHDNGGLHRATHPGAGAISHYYGMTGTAEDVIPAGSELTVNYGDWNFGSGEDEYKKPKRDVAWLHENGMCVDNIEVQTATDPQMGRGAFVTRNLPKGSLVAPAPIEITRSRKESIHFNAENEVEPLFVNYNYYVGDMLFFPYGPGVNLINHSAEKANVRLQWSTSKFHHAEWLELSQDEMWEKSTPGGLILEVVALRDLMKGEELFLDYGKDWQDAWNKHVQEWKPVEGALDYVYPGEMDETLPLRTIKEQETDPYPANLMTVCSTPDEHRKKSNVVEWYDRDDDRYEFPFRLVVCHILERKDDKHGDLVYHVQLDWDGIEYNPDVPKDERYLDLFVPRRAIRFVDKPDMSDQHLLNGFRHPIALPADIVPPQWKAKQSS